MMRPYAIRNTCRSCVIDALVDRCIEALGRLVGIELFCKLSVVSRNVRGGYTCVVAI